MFPHILFPIDFSEQSRALSRSVEWLAHRFHSQVTLHVVDGPARRDGVSESILASEQQVLSRMHQAKQQLKEYSLHLPASQVQRVLVEGHVALQMTKWVDEHEVDLIVMATHGQGSAQNTRLGSVAAKVLHDVDCPVWTDARGQGPASEQATTVVSHLLCAIELTEEAVPLLRFTAQLARELGATVHLVHCVPEGRSSPRESVRGPDPSLESARAEITQRQQEAETDFSVSLCRTPIPRAVADLADQQCADLVVMGRGKSREALGHLRTHAYDIIRQAPCPVLSYCLGQQPRTSSSAAAQFSV
jgi:nucleotide-binding universal stress UspA family protein